MSRFTKYLKWTREKHAINYIYFSLILLFLIALNIRHFIALEAPLSTLFLLYAVGQALFEVGTFTLVYVSLRKGIRFLLITLSFILCLVHFTDFTLIRLMDASVAYLFKFIFYSGFLRVLQAVNMNTSMIAIIALALIFIPLAGPLFYWLTNFLSRKKPLRLSIFQLAVFLGGIGFSLFAIDLLVHPFLNRAQYATLQKMLPFKGTIYSPSPYCIDLPAPLLAARKEPEEVPTLPLKDGRPNLYFFIIETLRRDFVTEETAPHMTAFARENLDFPLSFANSDATQFSWFSLLHSDFPHHWLGMSDTWEKGAVPLRLLKKLGYRINVYASADLRYLDMDKFLFGHEKELADQVREYSSNSSLEPCERDALAIKDFSQDLGSGLSANAYFFFFDGTHSEYSFPKDFPLKFEPIVPHINYLTLTEKKIEPVKNRYRNAIHYADHLVGQFFATLKTHKVYDEAIIILTGDHGEEFFEEGAAFHGTHLNQFQTCVPIFCKLPAFLGPPQTVQATHMDLFPSILHGLTGRSDFSELFDGESLFKENRWPYRIAVLQNGPTNPREFIIAKGDNELRLRFLSDIPYQQTQLELIDVKVPGFDSDKEVSRDWIDLHFPGALTPLLSRQP
jgi:glucan phosphoethanolaminetransferase (alkaline phosphatase superfamily)